MNSTYVQTEEEQRQWLSTLAYDPSFDAGAPVDGFSHTEVRYCPSGYPDYFCPRLEYPRPHVYGAYETLDQQQACWIWNNFNLESKASHLEGDLNGSSSPPWSNPEISTHSNVAFPTPLNYQQISPRAYLDQASQVVQAYRDNSIASQDSNEQNSTISVAPGSSLNTAEFVDSPVVLERKIFQPSMEVDADGETPRPQSPKWVGDEYTASWIRGSGTERVGWCGFCPTWHRLKDSAYWYHMHYSHGISCVTGRPFKEPKCWRQKQGITAFEALCGTCEKWVYIGKLDRWRTPYFRHAYKCQMKKLPKRTTSGIRSKSSSPTTGQG